MSFSSQEQPQAASHSVPSGRVWPHAQARPPQAFLGGGGSHAPVPDPVPDPDRDPAHCPQGRGVACEAARALCTGRGPAQELGWAPANVSSFVTTVPEDHVTSVLQTGKRGLVTRLHRSWEKKAGQEPTPVTPEPGAFRPHRGPCLVLENASARGLAASGWGPLGARGPWPVARGGCLCAAPPARRAWTRELARPEPEA